MDIIIDLKTYTASEAREKLYRLIRMAGSGLRTFEIILRGAEPVILMNRAELESWQETIDILTNRREINSLRKARKEKKLISHKRLLKTLKMKNGD